MLWTLVAVLCIVGGGLRHLHNEGRRARVGASRLLAARQNQIQKQAMQPVRDLWAKNASNGALSGSMSKADVEVALTGGTPLVTRLQHEYEIATLAVPGDASIVELKFRAGKWVGYAMVANSNVPRAPIPPSDEFTEAIRRLIAGWWSGLGMWTWLGLVLAALVFRHRFGRVFAELALAVAVVTTMAWLVAPNYSLTLQGIFSNDMLAVGTVMLLATVGLIAMPLSRRQPDPRLCTRCGYDLTGNVSGTCPECGTGVAAAQMNELTTTR